MCQSEKEREREREREREKGRDRDFNIKSHSIINRKAISPVFKTNSKRFTIPPEVVSYNRQFSLLTMIASHSK